MCVCVSFVYKAFKLTWLHLNTEALNQIVIEP